MALSATPADTATPPTRTATVSPEGNSQLRAAPLPRNGACSDSSLQLLTCLPNRPPCVPWGPLHSERPLPGLVVLACQRACQAQAGSARGHLHSVARGHPPHLAFSPPSNGLPRIHRTGPFQNDRWSASAITIDVHRHARQLQRGPSTKVTPTPICPPFYLPT